MSSAKSRGTEGDEQLFARSKRSLQMTLRASFHDRIDSRRHLRAFLPMRHRSAPCRGVKPEVFEVTLRTADEACLSDSAKVGAATAM